MRFLKISRQRKLWAGKQFFCKVYTYSLDSRKRPLSCSLSYSNSSRLDDSLLEENTSSTLNVLPTLGYDCDANNFCNRKKKENLQMV